MHKALSQQWGTGEMAELSGALTALPDPSSVFTTHAGEPELLHPAWLQRRAFVGRGGNTEQTNT